MDDGVGSVILMILVGCASYAAYDGLFYQTGKQWFDTCWTAQNSGRKPSSPEEAASWRSCEKTATAAFYDAGFIYAEAPQNPHTAPGDAIAAACPSVFSDISMAGLQFNLVEMMEASGGPAFMDRFLPAKSYITRTLKHRWPDCQTKRMQFGFPKVVERSGSYQWEQECQPCKAVSYTRQK